MSNEFTFVVGRSLGLLDYPPQRVTDTRDPVAVRDESVEQRKDETYFQAGRFHHYRRVSASILDERKEIKYTFLKPPFTLRRAS